MSQLTYVTWLSVEVEALFVFPAISEIRPDAIDAVTISSSVIHVTVNSKLVALLGATSVGPDVTVPVVQESEISPVVKLPILIGSSNTTLNVALSTIVGST